LLPPWRGRRVQSARRGPLPAAEQPVRAATTRGWRGPHDHLPGREDGIGDAAHLHADDPAPDGSEAPRL